MFKISSSLLSLATLHFLLVTPVNAQCPVCIVTAGGGMLLARKMGIDDLLVSIWIGAVNVAISFWLADKIKTKFKILKNPYFMTALMLAITLYYFFFTSQVTSVSGPVLGLDKILAGNLFGTVSMIAGNQIYQSTKSKLGHTPFPYAKVVFPILLVLLVTIFSKLAFLRS